ncbi:hypothetical protein EYF80_048800 [Liparis tanakae]|uniref:Uncharacterized protein n=1 Tax=Liparis tanakae TaxID=230148 RepID=A0A4Z2FJ85_9TELE|nr:hypothetical protein EYF80_048800 [Liparis tanakae]
MATQNLGIGNIRHVFGAGLPVEVVRALSDDDHGAALLPQPGLALRDGQVGGAGLLVQGQLPPVVVELPHARRGPGEGLRGGQVLWVGTPLSALTPAPVMMAMCLALEKTSRNSDMSGERNTRKSSR